MGDLLEVHVEELEWLWRRRCEAWRSPAYDARALTLLDERIASHTDALVLAGEDSLPLLLMRLLEADNAHVAMGAAYALLLQEDGAVPPRALDLFVELDGASWEGFRLALRYAPPVRYVEALRRITMASSERHAVAAMEALAFHEQPEVGERLLELLGANDPEIRRAAWGIVSLLGPGRLETPGLARFRQQLAECFPKALVDSAPPVRAAAREAAAWTRQEGLLPRLRELVVAPEAADTLPALRLLAVLGTPVDLPLFQSVTGRHGLGPERFVLLGTFGHPSLMEEVLRAMELGGPATAAAASRAFRKMTGLDVDTSQRVALPPEEGQEAGEDSMEEVHIPDTALARAHWGRLKTGLSGATRLSHGLDAGKGWAEDRLRALPLDARWEHSLRECFATGRGEGLAPLERFPQWVG